MGGGEGGHDLGVLRIVVAARQARGQMGLQVVQPVRRDLLDPHPGAPLSGREAAQGRHPGLAGGDDQAALGFVLDLRREQFGQLAPQFGGGEGEGEFGAGLLVGEQEVALMRRRWCRPRRGRGRRR